MTDLPEPSLHDQLLADYEAHEDAIEKAANTELWALGDWLAKYVPPSNGGAGMHHAKVQAGPHLTVGDLAGRRGRSRQWLSDLRKLALATAADRLPQVTPTAYHEALRATKWDLMAANQRLVTLGPRKRDQREGPHESLEAISREIGKRPPEDRAELVRELMADPTVAELLGGEPLPDFGGAWADKYVVRLEEQADKLTSLVRHEGLVFSPDADLPWFLGALKRTERQVADVRAAVQERLRDAELEVH